MTNNIRSGTFTVAGTTTTAATNVTVNTTNAIRYADYTFAATNFTLVNGANTFTAIAKDAWGNISTNVSVATLLATNNYSYDLNGNLRTNGNQVLDYDDENQLIRVTVTNAWKDEFAYDGKLRRRIERDYTWSGSAWTETNEVHFIYDGNVVLEERNSNNVPLVTYTRGNDLSGTLQGAGGIGGLLARSDHSQPPTPYYSAHSYYHADGNGNITMLINADQVMVAKYLYDSYGNTLSMSGSLASQNSYRFSSKEWNNNIGYYYYLYRYYDPNLQRWINRDPIQERGGLNLYELCINDPIDGVDLFGLATKAIGCNKNKCCAENVKNLEYNLSLVQEEISINFTPNFLQQALSATPRQSGPYANGRQAWNGHVEKVWGILGACENCAAVIAIQKAQGLCKNDPGDMNNIRTRIQALRSAVWSWMIPEDAPVIPPQFVVPAVPMPGQAPATEPVPFRLPIYIFEPAI